MGTETERGRLPTTPTPPPSGLKGTTGAGTVRSSGLLLRGTETDTPGSERETDPMTEYQGTEIDLLTDQETENDLVIRCLEILNGQKIGSDLLRDLLNQEVIDLEIEGLVPNYVKEVCLLGTEGLCHEDDQGHRVRDRGQGPGTGKDTGEESGGGLSGRPYHVIDRLMITTKHR